MPAAGHTLKSFVLDFAIHAQRACRLHNDQGRKSCKRSSKIALAVATGFVLGAGAIQALHAQAKLPAYLVAEINVRDRAGYDKEFLPIPLKTLKEAGGKYLAGGYDMAVGLSGIPPANR